MDTTLLIGNRDMPGLVTTDECIEAMEQAYLELGGGAAQELPRRRIYHPRDEQTESTPAPWWRALSVRSCSPISGPT